MCADTVHFPARQWAHSRHAQSGHKYDCALFQLVILGPLSALSVLIIRVNIVLVCSIYLDLVANNENIASLSQQGHKHVESNNNNDGSRK